MTKEALKLALEALEIGLPLIEDFGSKEQLNTQHKAIAAIYEVYEKAKQNSVIGVQYVQGIPFFPPPQRTWVGLTDEEVGNLSDFAYANDEEFVRNVEKHLKEKNSG
jgi:hypothetical protein